jgi:hypothetical protein
MSQFDALLAKIRAIPPIASGASPSKPFSVKKDMFGSFKGLVSSLDSKMGGSSPAVPASPGARRLSVSGSGSVNISGVASVAVIGLGYVGLPLACIFHDAGFNVVAFDVDAAKIAAFSSTSCYLPHLQVDWEQVCCNKSARFKASCAEADLRHCDVFIVCVPTPLGPNQEPDLSHVISATDLVARNLNAGCLFVLESTSFPGTTEEVCLPLLCKTGRTVGTDLFLAYVAVALHELSVTRCPDTPASARTLGMPFTVCAPSPRLLVDMMIVRSHWQTRCTLRALRPFTK